MKRHAILVVGILALVITPAGAGISPEPLRISAPANPQSPASVKVLSLTVAGTWPDHFTPGERVVLLQDAPPGGADLLAGRAGTVVCADPCDGSGDLLISWDAWANGKADLTQCADAESLLYPPNSVIWVTPQEVLLGRPFNECGTIHESLKGCIYLETDDGQEYNLVAAWPYYAALSQGDTLAFGDRVQVWGLFNNTPPGPTEIRTCPQRDGDIYHPILSPCSKSDPDPDPGPDEIVIGIGGNALVLVKVSDNTYAGCTTISLELNFQALLSVEITPAPGVGGTWSGTLDPEVVGPGEATTEICVTVEDLDTGTLPPGNDVQVATVSIFAVPAP